jgi:hypothetical protein
MNEKYIMGLSMSVCYIFLMKLATCMARGHCYATMGMKAPLWQLRSLFKHIVVWDQITVQQWPEVIVGTHCCATGTCVMWHKEHIWNVSVLQRVHLLNLVWQSIISVSRSNRIRNLNLGKKVCPYFSLHFCPKFIFFYFCVLWKMMPVQHTIAYYQKKALRLGAVGCGVISWIMFTQNGV